ncbi:hypothetical protein [Mangrovicoccus ximenensis]|uniref:hypothetical protein n=1 Tax=Mangrovicoccus ximenensis TaxID=1911570 RepID=UPI001F34E543|nr:hypothetical protein [Mangrovicoccus ximenensis]
MLFVNGPALHGALAELAGQIAARTGCRLMTDLFVPRIERGAGAVEIECLHYPVLENAAILAEARNMVLVGSGEPVAFFAYPDKPSTPAPAGCRLLALCDPGMDIAWTLAALAEATGAAGAIPARVPHGLPDLPCGPLTPAAIGQALAALMPPAGRAATILRARRWRGPRRGGSGRPSA